MTPTLSTLLILIAIVAVLGVFVWSIKLYERSGPK